MVFLIESIAACVDDSNRPGGPVFHAKKLIALLLFGVLLGLLVRYVNGCTTFWCGLKKITYRAEPIKRRGYPRIRRIEDKALVKYDCGICF